MKRGLKAIYMHFKTAETNVHAASDLNHVIFVQSPLTSMLEG